MDTLLWQTRDGSIQDTDKLLKLYNHNPLTTLFVDDIYDSGQTIEGIKEHLPVSRWCTLITKSENGVEYSPLHSCPSDGKWIVFPWE
jgi:hypoxanthine phosphoribosyltransferase